MIDEQILNHLRCLETGSSLRWLAPDQLANINAAIDQGRIVNRLGKRVERQLDAGFINEAGTLVYAVIDNIPQLVIDEAIPTKQLDGNRVD